METKQEIIQYRERLDKTLASPDLKNKDILQTLIKKQLLHSSGQELEGCKEKVIETRTAEVSNFLDMLRTTSISESQGSKTNPPLHGEWKLKQDTEEFRVMYREGPQGTPFHTLLVEGYVDGPVDVCLCISWETSLYKKWWPQSSVPTFKIISSDCLQKIQIGEQISLVRMKVSWPLSTREAVVHFFLFEYFQDDMVIVLLNTVSDLESIGGTANGFTNEVIPEAKDVVRIDVVGGFALQKVTSERSYFRTIATMDMKLDFVPPSFINFVSRQLIGNGFRLYQKAVSSMLNHNEEFSKALGNQLYDRTREALLLISGSKKAVEGEEPKQDTSIIPSKDLENKQDNLKDVDQNNKSNSYANKSTAKNVLVTDASKACGEIEEEDTGNIREFEEYSKERDDLSIEEVCEIEEEDTERIRQFEDDCKEQDAPSHAEVAKRSKPDIKQNIHISAEVEEALGTLEKVISMVREYGFNSPCEQKGNVIDLNSQEVYQLCPKKAVSFDVSNKDFLEGASEEPPRIINHSRCTLKNPNSKEVNCNRVVPASPEQNLPIPNEASQFALCSSKNEATEVMCLDQTLHSNKEINFVTNSIRDTTLNIPKKSSRQRKYRYCCFSTNS
ncbi:Polyketide cyclase/dehydrase and lipid transport superfamily protein [Quillaja saponaria]|uniref:Polyketide cyclase/dehydrase and lipid transport superfamily protein n=1 Tax=Quillaja saponaria TaxID=32244 RepID=A0AAD7PY47_QUISA|nr:Polyketide cyclase/dehydrase and lipid transport superfamily protein [Quillaja saponaria]